MNRHNEQLRYEQLLQDNKQTVAGSASFERTLLVAEAYNAWACIDAFMSETTHGTDMWELGFNVLEQITPDNDAQIMERNNAFGRAYSTRSETYRLMARFATGGKKAGELGKRAKEAEELYQAAINDYNTATDYFIETGNSVWQVIVRLQSLFARFRLAELRDDFVTCAALLENMEVISNFADAPRKVDAYRRQCAMMKSLLNHEMEQLAKEDELQHRMRIEQYYQKFLLYYAKGLGKAIRLYDAYNATRMTLDAIEVVMAVRGIEKATIFYSRVWEGRVQGYLAEDLQYARMNLTEIGIERSISSIMSKDSRFVCVLEGFAKLILATGQLWHQNPNNKDKVTALTMQMVDGLATLKADMAEEHVQLDQQVGEIEKLTRQGLIDRDYIPLIYSNLKRFADSLSPERDEWLVELGKDALYPVLVQSWK